MSTTPGPQREGKQKGTGARLIGVGLVLIVIGLAIVLLVDSGTPKGIGVALMLLGALPAIAGAVIAGSAMISARSRKGKPFA